MYILKIILFLSDVGGYELFGGSSLNYYYINVYFGLE